MGFAPPFHRVAWPSSFLIKETGPRPILQNLTLVLNLPLRFSESSPVRARLTGSKAVLGSLVGFFAGLAPREVTVA
jgi:hypothetical protein